MKGVTDMKEEKELFQKIGKENPFKVPEGYFENLTQQVMERLPEKDEGQERKEPVSKSV